MFHPFCLAAISNTVMWSDGSPDPSKVFTKVGILIFSALRPCAMASVKGPFVDLGLQGAVKSSSLLLRRGFQCPVSLSEFSDSDEIFLLNPLLLLASSKEDPSEDGDYGSSLGGVPRPLRRL